jgi:hypothetical protein
VKACGSTLVSECCVGATALFAPLFMTSLFCVHAFSFLFQTQNGNTARDFAVQNDRAEVVALLDAHAVSGRVGEERGR